MSGLTLPYPFCLKNNTCTSYLQASSSKPDSESTLSSSKWLSTSSFSFRSSFGSIALSQGFSTVHPKTFHRRKNSQTLILQFDWVFLDTALALLARVLYDYSRRFSRTISQNNNVSGLIWQSRMYQWEKMVNNALNCHIMFKVLVWLKMQCIVRLTA